MTNVSDVTVTSLETITLFDIVTGDFLFELDELQDATISNTEETSDVTGKGGRKLNTLKKNKSVTISGNNGLISGGLLEMQTGGTFETKEETPIEWKDYLAINFDAATTEYKAVGTEGSEINTVYIKTINGTIGEKLKQDAEPGPGKFAYDPKTREITFEAGKYPNGTEIVVYYTRHIKGDVVSNMSDLYSKKGKMYIDAFGEDRCGNTYRIQFYIPKADFNGNFDIQLGNDQAIHAFEITSLAGSGCSTLGSSGELWTYTIFGTNTADTETGADRMEIVPQESDTGYGKNASELMNDDVAIAWTGTSGVVTGTFKNVTDWQQLPSGTKEGHFFALTLDNKYLDKPFDFVNETAGTTSHVDKASADEMFWVLRIDDNKKFTFKSDGEVILSLDFTKATLEP